MTNETMIDRARQALQDHAWHDAYDAFATVHAEQHMRGDDLEKLAEAAWWTARPQESMDALGRAYETYRAEGNERRAAFVALQLSDRCNDRLESAQSAGWLRRATRLLEGLPESPEHGYLELALSRRSDTPEETMRHATACLEIGTRFGDADLQAFGLMCQGMANILDARVDEGMSLIDEATVAAVGGELSPFATGVVYCMTIVICRDMADYRRAGEWTDATTRWCERQSISGFPGHCRVRRAEIMRLRGAFADAEVEARRAVDELLAFGEIPIAGAGFDEIGEIRLRMGDLAGAEEAFAQAHERGNDAQPGLAMLQLARGRLVAARSSIRAALAGQSLALGRARLLPAAAEIALASHDAAEAREAADELHEIAGSLRRRPVARERPPGSGCVPDRRRGCGGRDRRAPDRGPRLDRGGPAVRDGAGAAMARVGPSRRRRRGVGRGGTALRPVDVRTAGCRDRGRHVRRDAGGGREGGVGSPRGSHVHVHRHRRLDRSARDDGGRGLGRRDALAQRHAAGADRHAHGGEVVHGTGDGFFTTFEGATSAASCAVDIQRRLADHRRAHGFAPPVRIGLHAAEATVVADDYAGIGVHQAARVGAIAEGAEILVTRETLDTEPIPFPVTDERTVSLKGLAQPVTVASVDWRQGRG